MYFSFQETSSKFEKKNLLWRIFWKLCQSVGVAVLSSMSSINFSYNCPSTLGIMLWIYPLKGVRVDMSIPKRVQGQTGWDLGQPELVANLVVGNLARGRWVETLRSLSTQTILWFCEIIKNHLDDLQIPSCLDIHLCPPLRPTVTSPEWSPPAATCILHLCSARWGRERRMTEVRTLDHLVWYYTK